MMIKFYNKTNIRRLFTNNTDSTTLLPFTPWLMTPDWTWENVAGYDDEGRFSRAKISRARANTRLAIFPGGNGRAFLFFQAVVVWKKTLEIKEGTNATSLDVHWGRSLFFFRERGRFKGLNGCLRSRDSFCFFSLVFFLYFCFLRSPLENWLAATFQLKSFQCVAYVRFVAWIYRFCERLSSLKRQCDLNWNLFLSKWSFFLVV